MGSGGRTADRFPALRDLVGTVVDSSNFKLDVITLRIELIQKKFVAEGKVVRTATQKFINKI